MEETLEDPNLRFADIDELKAILTFKIGVPTPLLLISRAISAEITKYVERVTPSVAASIQTHRCVAPSLLFQDQWSRSRLVLGHFCGFNLWFLNNVPPSLASNLHDLVIESSMMAADDEPCRAIWHQRDGEGKSFIMNFLSERFPSMESISISVPATIEQMEWYMGNAPGQILQLLQEGRVDVVRFFSTGAVHKCDADDWLRREVGPFSLVPHKAVGAVDQRYMVPSRVPRIFDVVEEDVSGIFHTSWKLLRATRVIRITRWEDAKIGSQTYTEWKWREL